MEYRVSGTRKSRRERPRRWHPVVPARHTGHRMCELLKRRASWRWPALALLVCFTGPGLASEVPDSIVDELRPAQMQSGSLLMRMQSGYRVATRMNTDIDLSVSGLIARVSVRQNFLNDGDEWVEGMYVFPLPDDAAVDRLRIRIGERFIEGEIRAREQAKREYREAKALGKRASLVEQQRANLFTTSVANIGPGEKVTVEVGYLQNLKYEEGTFSLRFPLTLTPRFIPGAPLPDRRGSGWSADTTRVPDASLITPPVVTKSKDHKLTLNAGINAGVPLQIVASRYHPIEVKPVDDGYVVTLMNGTAPLDHDLELLWRPVPDAAPRAMLFSEMLGETPYVLLMMLPPNDAGAQPAIVPRELIFVIDTSGSMHGTSIEQAKRALYLALDGLKSVDRFNIIQFNSVTSSMSPQSVAATPGLVRMARAYIRGLEANGGTNMRPALERVLAAATSETHLRQVIFITDGSVGNEQELYRLIERDLGSARLFTVGIGSAPNGWFMRKAAEAGRGTYSYISALHEIDEKMQRLIRRLEQPQITDISIKWPDGLGPVSYPETVPDLYAGEPVVVKARLAMKPRRGDLVSVGGNSAGGSWGGELALARSSDSPGIAALWARARIEKLLDDERRGADPDETRAAVVKTALDHHLVSKFTSLVAVDKTPVRPISAGLDSEQVPNLLPYGQSHEAIFSFPATATDAPEHRLIGIACLLATLLLLLLSRVQGSILVAATAP
ncbi:MAG: marine proteobacterial sortase target protein [Woeseia sp.]